MPTRGIDLPELMEGFHSEDKCRTYLEDLRWPNGVACLRCAHPSVSRIQKRHVFECRSCRHQFSVRYGTILQDSKVPLSKWLLTVYIMVESNKGVSSKQLKRMVGVSYPTAWYLSHRIRSAIGQVLQRQFAGTVEGDETRLGGKGRCGPIVENKTIVVGAVEPDEEMRLKVAPNIRKATLHAFIREQMADRAQAVHMDESRSYEGIPDEDTRHETMNHSAKEYVPGDVHTTSNENVWRLFKRSILGPYRNKVSEKHLAAYLDEMEWRFNNRDNPYLFRDTVKGLLAADPLEYQDLTA